MSLCEENLFQIPFSQKNTNQEEQINLCPINLNEFLKDSQSSIDQNSSPPILTLLPKDLSKFDPSPDKNKDESVREKSTLSREFRCEENGCDKVYRTKENLKLHILNIHLNLKPYECSYCSRRFSHRNGKTYHERKFHMNYLPYKCKIDECCKNFANKSSLNYHLKFHHKLIKFLLKKYEQ